MHTRTTRTHHTRIHACTRAHTSCLFEVKKNIYFLINKIKICLNNKMFI